MEKAEKENEKTSENENEKTDLRLDESKLSRHKFERLVRIFKSGRRRRSLDPVGYAKVCVPFLNSIGYEMVIWITDCTTN
eukprot:g4841.t1